MTVALVTCEDMPKPDRDEPFLLGALDDRGIAYEVHGWDDDIAWADFELVLIRTPWDYVDHLDSFLDWMERVEQDTQIANPLAMVEWNIHKRYLFDLETEGVRIVPTQMVAHHAPFPFQRAALRRFEGEVVIKPAVGFGAIGAERLTVGSDEAFAHLEVRCLLGDVLIQPLVASVTDRGEVSLVHIGGEYSHAVRKVPAAGDYRVQDHHGGSVVDHEPSAEELALADAALAVAASETGEYPTYARVDLVDLPTGPAVMELELIEPELFLRRAPGSAERLADAVAQRLR